MVIFFNTKITEKLKNAYTISCKPENPCCRE